jgi:hypothetical protein
MQRLTSEEVLQQQQRRFSLHGERVMPDVDLVLLYGIASKRRSAPIRRRRLRFPDDFMFN